ncbi:hypothetical protein C8A05DRAFT_44664 [Staphylotrichum tortipilum]|uniref:Rhodopsin domain-containing protein n=1 Tax=Staphylotrichum tortipilum TaxID=2831512 RepID=A0AAN6RT25_9PEZI|nr:hypothetical protein C8A05DRAFT_44664 [Staphylotrichum longicolle]
MGEAAPDSSSPTGQNKGAVILGVSYTTTFLALLFVTGRLFSRRRKLGKWAADDYIVLFSAGLVTLATAFVTAAIAGGGGRHSSTLSQSQVQLVSVLILVGLTLGALSFTLTKIAVVILLIKLLHPSQCHTRVLWGLVGGNVLFMSVAGLVFFLQCMPPQALWNQYIKHKCWDPVVATSLATSASAFSALSDFYLALYPAVVLWSLDMNWRKKLALSVALGFGVCAGSVAIYKCTTVSNLNNRDDFTYTATDVIIWATVEANCVLIAACIPMLMPLLELWFGAYFLSRRTLRLQERGVSTTTWGETALTTV